MYTGVRRIITSPSFICTMASPITYRGSEKYTFMFVCAHTLYAIMRMINLAKCVLCARSRARTRKSRCTSHILYTASAEAKKEGNNHHTHTSEGEWERQNCITLSTRPYIFHIFQRCFFYTAYVCVCNGESHRWYKPDRDEISLFMYTFVGETKKSFN